MSLIRILKKRRRIGVPRCATPEESQRADHLSMRLAMLARRPETILVNIQSVVNDLVVDPNQQIAIDWRETPHMTPPYPSMWLEAVALGQRFALQVLRDAGGQPAQDGRSGFKTVIYFWQEENAEVVGPSGQSTLWLDETGGVTSAEFRVIGELHEPPDEVESGQQILTFIAAHTLARMNCRNVVLRPMATPKVPRRRQRDLVPATVWHDIHIDNVPQIRSASRGIPSREESRMRRFWVRGHFADYRKGAGLFGNPELRCVFWIPEHQRGNPELGDVIPEYTLTRSTQPAEKTGLER